MGQWFAQFFKDVFDVTIYDIDSEKVATLADDLGIHAAETLPDLVNNCHLLILATPLMTMPQMIEDLAPLLNFDMVLIDIAGIKSPIIDILKRTTQLTNVLSIHPLFGPSTKTLQGKSIVLMPVTKNVTSANRVRNMISMFTSSGATIVEIPLEEHDKQISRVLNLSHLLNMAFAMTLRNTVESPSTFLQIATTTFNAQLTLAEAVASENPNHYARLQVSNPYAINVLDQLMGALNELRNILSENNISAFVQILKDNQQYLANDPNFSSAKDKLYQLLETDNH
jgi:chorismate mutase/prephenate dehydrogenase